MLLYVMCTHCRVGALLALVELLMLRTLIAMRNCGGGSWINTVERCVVSRRMLPFRSLSSSVCAPNPSLAHAVTLCKSFSVSHRLTHSPTLPTHHPRRLLFRDIAIACIIG